MKVFVTGGAGYIGSVTTEQLLNAGHEVVVFDNLSRGHMEAVDTRAAFVKGDLCDAEGLAAVMKEHKPDAVMHFAAFALVEESMRMPELYFRNNLVGGINLAEAMLKADVSRIVFSSTCATYGQPDIVPITETESQVPENSYGESKLGFEKVLKWYSSVYGMKTIPLRYFNACGATEKFGEDHTPETHIIPIVLQASMGKRDKVYIFGEDYDTPDGSCVRDYIHIVDLAQAHMLALDVEESGAFNLGNGSGYSVKEVIDVARKVTGSDIIAEPAGRRAGDPARLVARADKARDVLGWKPEYPDLESIIASAWEWHQSHPDGYSS